MPSRLFGRLPPGDLHVCSCGLSQLRIAADGGRRQTGRVQVRMVFQPFRDDLSLHRVLELALADERLSEFTVVVAWAKESGLSRIRPLLQAFRARGGTARILLGVDEGGATIEGLHAAMNDFDEASVLNDPSSGTFHPKLYVISGEAASVIIIGSSNLTRGGLFANYEAGVCLDLDLIQAADVQAHEAVMQFIQRLQNDGTSRTLTGDLIQQLLDNARYSIGCGKSSPSTADALGNPGATPSLFGVSHHAKNKDPGSGPVDMSRQAAGAQGAIQTENRGVLYPDAKTAERVEKFGEVAQRHKEFIDRHVSMTRADSLTIRRQMYGLGQGVQRTVTLFTGSGAILWMDHQEDGKTRNKDLVGLTAEGTRIAKLWQASQTTGDASL
jgi:HKD family nuclease